MMTINYTQLPTADLRPGYGPSAYRETDCSPPLLGSLKRYGQLFPLLVTEGESGFILVCGHRRAGGITELGFHSVDVIVIPPVTDLEILRLSVSDNGTSTGFTDAERIRILKRLFMAHDVAEFDVAEYWMPLLSLPASRDLAAKYRRLCSDPTLFQAVDTGVITPGNALRTLIIPDEIRPAILSLIKAWKLTTSESRECIHILDELIRRDGMSYEDIVSLTADDSGLSTLRRIRFPQQAQRHKKLEKLKATFPAGCTLRQARNEGLSMEVVFTGRKELIEKLRFLRQALDSDETRDAIDSF